MNDRVNSLETQIALIKSEIHILKNKEIHLPEWIRNAASAVILAIFAQTITTVWWASEISARHTALEAQVEKNTTFIDELPAMHERVMLGLREIQIENRHMREMLADIKTNIYK